MQRGIGPLGEDIAAHHLVTRDRLVVIARNWRPEHPEVRGEVDIVAHDPADATLVVCEVKTRRDATRFGGAVAALGRPQRARLRLLAAECARQLTQPVRTIRGDLVAVDLGRAPMVTHVIDAW